MYYGRLVVIPDESKISGGVFDEEVRINHLVNIKNFVNYYNLGYEFNNDDYQEAPCQLARDGHLVIKTVDDVLNFICYIPEVVSDDQLMWFYNNQDFINKYCMVGGYYIKDDDIGMVDGFENIMNLLKKKNLRYDKYSSNNVRKG